MNTQQLKLYIGVGALIVGGMVVLLMANPDQFMMGR